VYICVNTVTNSVPLELLDIICNLCYCFKIETCIIGDICEYICEHSHELNLTWATWYLSPVTYVTVLRSKPVTQVTYVNIHVNTNYICEYTCEYSHELNPTWTARYDLYHRLQVISREISSGIEFVTIFTYRLQVISSSSSGIEFVTMGLSSWLYSHIYSHVKPVLRVSISRP